MNEVSDYDEFILSEAKGQFLVMLGVLKKYIH